ncbi:hypothetical protein C0J52_28341, partial [Blattella germanica]
LYCTIYLNLRNPSTKKFAIEELLNFSKTLLHTKSGLPDPSPINLPTIKSTTHRLIESHELLDVALTATVSIIWRLVDREHLGEGWQGDFPLPKIDNFVVGVIVVDWLCMKCHSLEILL